MKKILLILIAGFCVMQVSAQSNYSVMFVAQGTVKVTSGAYITGAGASWIVLDNTNVVNDGNIVLSASGNTIKTTGNTPTNQTGAGITQLDNFINNTSSTFTLAEPVSLYNQLSLTSGTLASSGFLTLKSTATNTAMVLPVTSGTATGDVNVERFISSAYARAAWRLLTAPLRSNTAANGNIYNNWQNAGVNTTGKGTRVTGPTYAPGNGLDEYSYGGSMLWFDGTNLQNVSTTNNPAVTPLFTTTAPPVAANNSFFVFVRGDRNTLPGSQSTTTLSATGGLQIGNQSFATNTAPDGFTLIGNPYASPVDLDLFRQGNSGSNIKTTYYYWDPYISGTISTGAYVTVSYDGPVAGTYTITPAGADHTTHLQSGQAMFVQTVSPAAGTPSVTFTETQKSTTNVNNIFRTSGGNIEGLAINLNVVAAGTGVLVDGIAAKFDNIYSAAVDNYDAAKFYNFAESISFVRDNKVLSIERRPQIKSDDVLYLNLTGLRTDRVYQFAFTPDFNAPTFTAWIKDNYLNTLTPIDVNTKSTVDFTVTGDAASKGAGRFSIVFSKPASVIAAGKPSISVYPNPVTNGIINLQMSNMAAGNYVAKVLNNSGQVIVTRIIKHVAGTTLETIAVGKVIATGTYHVEVTMPDNTKFITKIIAD